MPNLHDPRLPRLPSEGFAPHPCGLKLTPAGAELCRSCHEKRRQMIMDNLPPTHPDYPRSSRPVFGVRGTGRRQALQPPPRAFGTPDGQVANTPPVATMPGSTDTAPLDGIVDDEKPA